MTRPPTTVSHTGLSGSSSAGGSTGSSASPVRSARIPTRMRPATPSSPATQRRGERVARQRLVRGQRLVGQDGCSAGGSRRSCAAASPSRGSASATGQSLPSVEHGARVDQVAHPERPGGALRPEPLVPVAGAVAAQRGEVDGLHRGDHARAGDRCDQIVRERLEVLQPVAPRPRARRRRGRSARRRRRSCAWRPGSPRPANFASTRPAAPGRARTSSPPSPCVSGASSQAVPESITPSAKNLATPPRHSRPRASRSASHASISSSLTSGVMPQRHAQAHRQLLGALEVAQEVDASRARRPSRARPSARARSGAAACSTWRRAHLRPAQPRRGAQHQVLRARLVQLAGRHAVRRRRPRSASGEGVRAGHLRELQRARRGERRVQVREPDERRRAAHRVARSPPASAPRRSPAPTRTASRARGSAAASAASTSAWASRLRVDPARELRAPERVQVRVHQARGSAPRRGRR